MKILVVRLSSFGDQIHVCPAVTDLKRQRPDIEIHWLTQSEFAAVPQAHLSVSKVFSLPLTALRRKPLQLSLWGEFFRTVRNLRKEHYQVAIDVHGMIKSAVMVMMSGAEMRVGYGPPGLAERPAYWMYHRHFQHTPGMTSVSKLRDFFRWVFELAPVSNAVDFGLSSQLCDRKRRNSILFVPFASGQGKTLSLDYWIDLASAFHAEAPAIDIRISWGSEHERKMALALEKRTKQLALPNSKRFDSMELIEFLRGFSMVVGMDTGLTQLANALGIPTVMIFTVSAPEYFFTPGSLNSMYIGSSESPPSSIDLRRESLNLYRKLSRYLS